MKPTETDRSYTTARIVAPSAQRMGAPSLAQLAAINARASVALAAEQVFVFDAVASTDAVDTYWTRMDAATTLPNFVTDFTAGRSLLDSHDIYTLPIGGSVAGVLEPVADAEGSDATTQVRVTFYLLRDATVNRKSTDEYIKHIEAGIFRRMSVGFGGPNARIVSEQDGKELWVSDYYPGQRLPDGTRAVFRVVDANGYECSLVYANSTPGALVSRMQQLVTERVIAPADLSFFEQAWQVRFDRPAAQQFLGGTRMNVTGRSMLAGVAQRMGKTLSAATRAKLESARSALADTTESVEAAMGELASLLETVDAEAEEGRAMKQQLGTRSMADVLADAAAGAEYRASLIERARAARVAVQGADFDAEKYAARLTKRELDEIKDEAEDWESRHRGAFYSGRQVKATDPNATPTGSGEYTVVRR